MRPCGISISILRLHGSRSRLRWSEPRSLPSRTAQRDLSFCAKIVTSLPALATCSRCASASFAAWSISAALSPTDAMKLEAVATFPVISLVVWFCSATAPLTFSNTGRIAWIACEIRCTASTDPAASRCSASIFFLISSVASWVCTASALTSEATTAKPRPAAPARAASMVELSASSVVCLAICAIRLTTLPIAADDSLRRSTLRLASWAAALASSASLPASRTCDPMPSAESANLPAACEKVAAVLWASFERRLSASVRWRTVDNVAAVACAPPATELAARSNWRIMPPSSISSSSRICRLDSASELSATAATATGFAWGSKPGEGGLGGGFRDNPRAIRSLGRRHDGLILPPRREIMVNKCLICRQSPLPPYRKCCQIFDFSELEAYKAALSIQITPHGPLENPHGRTFPVQEHHAPQGPPGRPEVEAVRQAGAGNHGGCEIGYARSGDESAAARGCDRRAAGEYAEGQYRARDQESARRRERELRRDPLRGLWPGRRGRHRRGAHRQPEPHRFRYPLLFHQVGRQSRRNRRGFVHVRSHRRHRI